ncbi:N-acetylglucosamine kinase [Streptomyces tsukubensis]|uniref:ATPase n=1 Tax=Streptomyces tsukubensis TaxID=83656 RepID=A0A1V3ZYG1_9ACTN|nr:BadF/BadG/BcrA/BcrD ATPase family protein [Streptomyces tsukubensis]OON71460.1 ATPase [Streptomyces tsukubensis]QFR97005.1 ATPase [Streptomyces tsukubensis]
MTAGAPRWVLGVDSGGSGLRVALAEADEPLRTRTAASREPVRTGAAGIDADHLLEQLLPMAQGLLEQAAREPMAPIGEKGSADGERAPHSAPSCAGGRNGPADSGHSLHAHPIHPKRPLPAAQHTADTPSRPADERATVARGAEGACGLAAIAIGAAGMATLGDGLRSALPKALATALGVRRLALAADGVTAYAGALGQRPGAVVAAGTGMIALGTDLLTWRRADGWGHLLGDCGGGAWIGRAGLDAAMRAHDGRRGGSTALLHRAEEMFGPAAGLPGALYPRTDRPAVLASFAPEVARQAADDPVAAGILAAAAGHIAEAAAAVCPKGAGAEIALTGGLFKMGDPLLVPLREELAAQVPGAALPPPAGDPLHGAVVIAAALAHGSLRLPQDGRLLHIPGHPPEPPRGDHTR